MATRAEDLIRRHRYTVEDYQRMGQAGILAEDDRVELVEGDIVEMAPIGTVHAGTVDYLVAALLRGVGELAIVRSQNPVILGTRSEPQPDLLLVRPRSDYYRLAHPIAGDALLAVEVADTTLRYDREVKIPLYARHGIPEAWLIDLEAKALYAFREPSAEGYRREAHITDLGAVGIERLPGVTLDLRALFGP